MPDTSGYQNLGGVKGSVFDSNLPYADPRKVAAAQENFQRRALLARMAQAAAMQDQSLSAQERIQGTPESRASAAAGSQLAVQGGTAADLQRLAAENQLRLRGGTDADLQTLAAVNQLALQGGSQADLARQQGEFVLEGQRISSQPGLLDAQRRTAESEQQRGFAAQDREVSDIIRQRIAEQLRAAAGAPAGAGTVAGEETVFTPELMRDLVRSTAGLGAAPSALDRRRQELEIQDLEQTVANRSASREVAGRLGQRSTTPRFEQIRDLAIAAGQSPEQASILAFTQTQEGIQNQMQDFGQRIADFYADDTGIENVLFGTDPSQDSLQQIAGQFEDLARDVVATSPEPQRDLERLIRDLRIQAPKRYDSDMTDALFAELDRIAREVTAAGQQRQTTAQAFQAFSEMRGR